MNQNDEFLQQEKLVKTVAGIVCIVSVPIIFVQAILVCLVSVHVLRMLSEIIMSFMLLAGGITMLAGRSRPVGGTENIVLFSIGLVFGVLGFGRLWYWAVWAALCLAASVYFRVMQPRQAPQQPVYQQPMYQPRQAPVQQPYQPQAAQAAANGYTAPFTVQPTKTMAELQQEALARGAAAQPAEAQQTAQEQQEK